LKSSLSRRISSARLRLVDHRAHRLRRLRRDAEALDVDAREKISQQSHAHDQLEDKDKNGLRFLHPSNGG